MKLRCTNPMLATATKTRTVRSGASSDYGGVMVMPASPDGATLLGTSGVKQQKSSDHHVLTLDQERRSGRN